LVPINLKENVFKGISNFLPKAFSDDNSSKPSESLSLEALEQEFVQRESDSSSEDEDASVMDVEDDVEIGNEDEGERDDEVSVSWYVNNSCY
jgi:hypothetical protein